jgi:hypothetical protein
MDLTFISWIIIPLGLCMFFWGSTERLFKFVLFFTPFSATSVVNFTATSPPVGFQVGMFLGILFIAKVTFFAILNENWSIKRTLMLPLSCIWGFCLVAAISMWVPMYVDGRFMLRPILLFGDEYAPLKFDTGNISQFIYLVYGALLATVVAAKIKTNFELTAVLKIIVLSICFISVWGLMQFVFNITGITYPEFIFNNSASPYAQGFESSLGGTDAVGILALVRVSSVTNEPSNLALYLVAGISIILEFILFKQSLLSKKIDILMLILMFICLILSLSSSGIFSLLVMIFTITFIYAIVNRKKAIYLFTTSILIMGLIIITLILDAVDFGLYGVIAEKMLSYSGMERANNITNAWGYFLEFPLLGVGWRKATSPDLFVNLLANTGAIGLLCFVGLLAVVLYRHCGLIKIAKNTHQNQLHGFAGQFAAIAGFLAVIVTDSVNGFSFVNGFFWILLGLAMTVSVTRSSCLKYNHNISNNLI